MFLGIDLGTSAVKVLLIDDDEQVRAEASCPVAEGVLEPPHSEQQPAQWIRSIETALDEIAATRPGAFGAVQAIGLSGHMHGAVLVDKQGEVLRPCIMWDDGRSVAQCKTLTRKADFTGIGGNLVMAGFTAPKLLWVAENEPEIFGKIHKVLLPKDYVRYWLTGEYWAEMSDASGTLWLDVAARRWSERLLGACGLTTDHMARLVEGTEATGTLLPHLANRWGFPKTTIVAGGAGDNAASACGMGVVADGASISLGTSGVVFAPTKTFAPQTGQAVHAFCHAAPGTWHQMGVILSAASCLEWLADLFGHSVADLLSALPHTVTRPATVQFQPHLTGVRTPYNNPLATASFLFLNSDTTKSDLVQATLEGVAFALRDCTAALASAGTRIETAYTVGGGARSEAWLQIISNVTGIELALPENSHNGAAIGAARLAMAAAHGGDISYITRKVKTLRSVAPEAGMHAAYEDAYHSYRAQYKGQTEIATPS
ncbi:xylulokinase [Rhodophyticola sp. CCM32]|nr:xylulokinase [Rhodophyticola sp. CCM32]